MKKINKKICIIYICLFCIICQILDNNVYAYSIDEVKEVSNFKTVEEDGEPENYDVLIDAQDLISNEKLPSGIRTTVEDVLYDNAGLLSIDFFGKEEKSTKQSKTSTSDKKKTTSTDTTESEDKTAENAKIVRDFVRNTYKVLLYIAAGAMIVVLIYMAIVTVTSGISPSLNILPFSGIINGKKGEKPNQYIKSKRLVEQWVTSVISLALAVFVMNLTVAFSDNIVNLMENKKVENEKITVYVKNSKFATNAPILGGSGSSSSVIQTKTVDYYFDTNLEGLLMFQSQYNAEEHPLKSGINMIAGMVVTLFKSLLYCMLVCRMLLLAGISAIAPILILVNSFMKISGGKGFLSNWIKLYLYLIFLRPVIAFIYYVLIQSNVYLMADAPILIVLILVAIFVLIIKSLIIMYRDFSGKKKKNAVSKS